MPACPPAPETQGALLEPLRILLAEDDVVSRRIAQLMLAKLGHRVDAVSNGLEAVDAVGRATYDVVLMDVQMPELDGLSATRRIRVELPAGRGPTIVALTASGSVEQQTACATAGMDAYLSKPLRFLALVELLASVRAHPAAGGDPHMPSEASAAAPAADPSPEGREAAVRRRLTELSGPDADDDGLLAALLRSFVSRTPHLLDQLELAVSDGPPAEVERVAHAVAGAAENLGCDELARGLRQVEARARAGELPAAEVLRRMRQEQSILRPILTGLADRMETPRGLPAG